MYVIYTYVCVCMYIYVNIRRHQHMPVRAHTGPQRHARALACRRNQSINQNPFTKPHTGNEKPIPAPPQGSPSKSHYTGCPRGRHPTQTTTGRPLHDIVIVNIVSCVATERGGRWGVVHCTMAVQWHCNDVGNTVGGGNVRMIDSRTTALK